MNKNLGIRKNKRERGGKAKLSNMARDLSLVGRKLGNLFNNKSLDCSSAIHPLYNVTRSPKPPVNVYCTKLPCGNKVIGLQRERAVFNFGGNSGTEKGVATRKPRQRWGRLTSPGNSQKSWRKGFSCLMRWGSEHLGPKWCHSWWKSRMPILDWIPDLIAVSTFPRSIILINQSRIFWSSTSKVICPVDPLHPP